jgi:hypothetical protein
MTGFKSNGARRPFHIVEKRLPPPPAETAAVPAPGTSGGGPLRLAAPQRQPVSLPVIPSLSRDLGLTVEDGLFMHAVRTAAEAMLEGAAELTAMEPLTIEQEGALVRAFGLPRRETAEGRA